MQVDELLREDGQLVGALARRSASQWQDSFPRHKPSLEAVCEKPRIREGGFPWTASTPIRRMGSGCCPRAASGHATAAPLRSVMNSRRFMPRSFDHLVGAAKQRNWDRQTESPGRLEI